MISLTNLTLSAHIVILVSFMGFKSEKRGDISSIRQSECKWLRRSNTTSKLSEAWHVYNSVFLIQYKICKNVDRCQTQIFMIIPGCCNDIILRRRGQTQHWPECHNATDTSWESPDSCYRGRETQETATDSRHGWTQTQSAVTRPNNSGDCKSLIVPFLVHFFNLQKLNCL